MINEKLEALMWRCSDTAAVQVGPCMYLHADSYDHAESFMSRHNADLRTARATGVEEGKLEAYAIAAKLADELTAAKLELERLREAAPLNAAAVNQGYSLGIERGKCEAAPVDDGRRWEIAWLGQGRPVQRYAHETFSETCADAICQARNSDGKLIYEARLVEPKHVHNWSPPATNGLGETVRLCVTVACGATQVAEWKDAK